MRTNLTRLERRIRLAEQMVPCGGPTPAELAFRHAVETVPELRALVHEQISILVSRPPNIPMTDTEAARLAELETSIDALAGELGLTRPR
jgi:hypothetical protein